jgi:hypothetical protein
MLYPVMTYTCNSAQHASVEHEFFLKITESATPDFNVMEWPLHAHHVGCVA